MSGESIVTSKASSDAEFNSGRIPRRADHTVVLILGISVRQEAQSDPDLTVVALGFSFTFLRCAVGCGMDGCLMDKAGAAVALSSLDGGHRSCARAGQRWLYGPACSWDLDVEKDGSVRTPLCCYGCGRLTASARSCQSTVLLNRRRPPLCEINGTRVSQASTRQLHCQPWPDRFPTLSR